MGNKHIDGVITDYFHELLDEGGDNNTPDEKDTTQSKQKEAVPDNTKAEPSIQKADASAGESVNSGPDKSFAKDEPAPSLKPEPAENEKPASTLKTEAEPAEPASYSPPTETRASVSTPVTSSAGSITDSMGGNRLAGDLKRGSYTAQAKPDTASTTDTSSTAYEQHKQRLEKMLQQVSVLETQTHTHTQTEATETPSALEQPLDLPAEEIQTEVAYQPLPPLSSEWLDNGRPNWAQERFDILLIEVNGLQLAVPLVALGQIQEIDEHLTPLFGQSDWFMGLQQSPMGSIKTVNTAKFVMPERYQDDHDYKYVVSINGLNWGLAVDCIHQPISIDPDTIRWRPNRSSRPWMAGMVKDHMCVLLDIPSMGELLQKQDKNHQESTGG